MAQTTKWDVAAFAADADGKYVFVNSHWCRLAGIGQDRALSQGWLQSVHPDDRDEVAQQWMEAVKGERHFSLSYRIYSAEAGTRFVLNQAIPQHDDDGALTGYGGTIIDQAQLSGSRFGQSSEPRLRAILDMFDIGYYELDPVTGDLSLSPNCRRFMAGSEARTLEESDAFVHPEDLPEAAQQYERILEERATFFVQEFRTMGRDNEWIKLRDYCKITYDADGKPLQIAGFIAPAEAFQGSIEDDEAAFLCRLTIQAAR